MASTPTDKPTSAVSKAQTDSSFIDLHTALIYTPHWSQVPVRLSAGEHLKSGERYKFLIMPEQDCYLYIFQTDIADKLSMLFPMETFGGVRVDNRNPLRAQQAYTLPGRESSFFLDRRRGTERIYLMAATHPDTLLETLGPQLNEDRDGAACTPVADQIMAYLNTKELIRATDKGNILTMDGKGNRKVTIDADRLQTSRDRVYLLEFEHR
jgi:hypothetical protein